MVITIMDLITIIDGTIPFDHLGSAHVEKVRKYSHLGNTLPFVVGSLRSWLPTNDHISVNLVITHSSWNSVRRDTHLLAIRESLTIARQQIRCKKDITSIPASPPLFYG